MTDADTPRVPDNLYWSADHNQVIDPRTLDLWGGQLPADAVKLGDVDAARLKARAQLIGEVREVEEECNEQEKRALAAERERDALREDLAATLGLLEVERETREAAESELANLRADIRAVLDAGCDDFDGCWDCVARHRRIRAILDREPGREEPTELDRIRDLDAFVDKIEAAVEDWNLGNVDEDALATLHEVIDLLDRRPAREGPRTDPRVFFPGDTVPAEVEVWTKHRSVYRWGKARQLLPYEGAMVEVLYPSPAEWQAIVDRARAARDECGSECPEPAPRTLHDIVFPDHIEVDQLNKPETTIVRLRCLPHTFGPVSSGWVNRGDTHLIREFVEAHAAHGHVAEHQPEPHRVILNHDCTVTDHLTDCPACVAKETSEEADRG